MDLIGYTIDNGLLFGLSLIELQIYWANKILPPKFSLIDQFASYIYYLDFDKICLEKVKEDVEMWMESR